jgi:hypothetical protein
MSVPFVGFGSSVVFGSGSPPSETLNGVTAISFSGDKVATEKTTDMTTPNGTDTFIASTDDPGSCDVKCWTLPGDPTQEAIKAAKVAKVPVSFIVSLPGSLGTRSFTGIVETATVSLPLEKNSTFDVKIKMPRRRNLWVSGGLRVAVD